MALSHFPVTYACWKEKSPDSCLSDYISFPEPGAELLPGQNNDPAVDFFRIPEAIFLRFIQNIELVQGPNLMKTICSSC
jgi:hypothetical protein